MLKEFPSDNILASRMNYFHTEKTYFSIIHIDIWLSHHIMLTPGWIWKHIKKNQTLIITNKILLELEKITNRTTEQKWILTNFLSIQNDFIAPQNKEKKWKHNVTSLKRFYPIMGYCIIYHCPVDWLLWSTNYSNYIADLTSFKYKQFCWKHLIAWHADTLL